jgi:spore maturation protein SpmA
MNSSAKNHRYSELAALALIAVLAMVVATGCGKPAYCQDVTNLQNAVKGLPNAATSGGVSGLESQLNTIESDAKTLQSSAKSDFPSEASAVESSISQLKTSVSSLPSKPTAQQLAAVGINASAVVSSVKSFQSATSSKCK